MKTRPGFDCSVIDLAYIAGLIDGEGCFDVHVDNRCQSLIPRIRVEMVERETIEWLWSKLPGEKIAVANRSNPNHSSTYRWSVQGQRALAVARLLIPYLKGKKCQAEIMLMFPYGVKPGYGRSVPADILSARIHVHDSLRELKKKGKGLIRNNYFYDRGGIINGKINESSGLS